MNKFLAAVALAWCWTAPPVTAHEAHKHGGNASVKEAGTAVTLEGEIVDMACYMAHEGKGKKHQKCAQMCALEGTPLGLLTKQSALYLLVEDHDNKKVYQAVKAKAGEFLKVTGKVVRRGGVAALIVSKAE